jgi:benzoyl-CoA reductase subunit C
MSNYTSEHYPEPAIEEFRQFRDWVDDPHDYGRDWKERTGGKVVAFFCTYAPREITYAGGMLSVRAYGGHQASDIAEADQHIYRGMWCPFSRDVLSQGLLGKYDYTDGIVMASTCLHLRQTYHSWADSVIDEDDFQHYFMMPHGTQQEGGVEYLAQKLRETTEAVEAFTGREITEDDLWEAIEVYDENRRLLREVYEYRKQEQPPISGLEALEMVKSSHIADPAEHNELLRSVLDQLEDYDGPRRDPDYRLMHISSENDDRRFMYMVEEDLGFDVTVVTEEACVGTRDFWNTTTDTYDDPYLTLAERYLERPPCPNKDWPYRRRMDQIGMLADEFDVDGALLIVQKFCDPHLLDVANERDLLEDELDIQTLELEFDASVPIGQFKTRVQAFVEQLQTDAVDMEALY